MKVACDKSGKLTALRLHAVGDTGAYASVGTKVMERVVGHATGAYTIPAVDIQAHTVYTNNIPSGAMRGFGVPQVVFAIESCLDDLCRQGGFDRWQLRYNNALEDGATTATGQKLQGVGLKKTLLAVKEPFKKAKQEWISTFERDYIDELLARHSGNISGAAREADIDRKYFRKLMTKYGIEADEYS